MAIKVKLRKKRISGGRESLYLDFYPAIPHPKTGLPTRRRFLKMYVLAEPRSSFDKEAKRETILIAEQIASKEQNRLNKPEIYTALEKEHAHTDAKRKQSFISFLNKMIDDKEGSNKIGYSATMKHIEQFGGADISIERIDDEFCIGFKKYLSSAIATTSPTEKPL